MTEPRPPEGARLVWPDGTMAPLLVTYVGIRNELHQWRVSLHPDVLRPLPTGFPDLLVDVLPAKTSLQIPKEFLLS